MFNLNHNTVRSKRPYAQKLLEKYQQVALANGYTVENTAGALRELQPMRESILRKMSLLLLPLAYKHGYILALDGDGNGVDVPFSRSTTATRVNRAGLIETVGVNVPRIDYTDGSARLLMEPSRTNVLRYADFDAAVPTDWSVSFGTGTYSHTLTQLKGKPAITHQQTTSGRSPITQNFVFSPSTTYTFRIYMPDIEVTGGNNIVLISDGVENHIGRVFDINADGYLTITFTTDPGAGAGYIRLGIGATSNATGHMTFGLPQLEEGSYPTSYIPTAGSAVTRSNDQIPIQSFFNLSHLSVYFEATTPITTSIDTTYNFRITSPSGFYAWSSRANTGFTIYTLESSGFYWDTGAQGQPKTLMRLSVESSGDFFVNGVKEVASKDLTADTTGNMTGLGYSQFVKKSACSKIIIFPLLLTDAECQELTAI